MRTTCVRITALIGWFFLSAAAWGQGLPPQSYDFSFDAVKGAGGYLVEFQDPAGQIVESQSLKATETHVSVSLPPGSYSLRLTTLNKLGRRESSSDWLPIHIAAPTPPRLVAMEAQSIVTWSPQTISLTVGAFAKDLSVAVRSPDGTVILAKEMKLGSDGTVSAVLPALTQAGAYALVVTNPPNLSLTVNEKLLVHYAPPVITELSPRTLDASNANRDLQILGRDFSTEVDVKLVRGGSDAAKKADPIPLSIANQPNVLGAKIPVDLPKGEYEVFVTNAANEKSVSAGSFRVTTDKIDTRQTLNTYGWVSLGTGVLSSTVAIAALIVGSGARSQYDGATDPNDIVTYRNQYVLMSNVLVPTAIGGLTTLATGIVLLFLGADK